METDPKTYTDVFRYDWLNAATDSDYSSTWCSTSTPAFIIYDETFKKAIGNSPRLTLIETRADKFAHEAGVYCQKTGKNYFASNYQSGKSTEIYSVESRTHQIEEHHFDHVTNGNGGCCYNDNIIFCCQGDLATPPALVLVDPVTCHSKILLNNFYGRPFNSINDVAVNHTNNDLWFTDPTYGFEQAFRPPPQLPSQVYRFQPQSGKLFCVADGFEQCNGLCFSPDYSKIYVTDTGAVQAHGTPGNGQNLSFNPRLPSAIYEYDVVGRGTRLSGRKLFAFCDNGVPDGIKCDGSGNVYAGCGDGIHVWDPTGVLIGKIYVAGAVANFNFARGGMWILAEEKLFLADIGVSGALEIVEGH
jgi:gluconolactonase